MFQKTRLAKQNALMDYLNARNLKGSSTDTIINNGECGKERPDRVFELEDKILIIECDENQHKDRNCECEQTRMVNISQSFGGTPVYFIRFNPDDYSSNKKPENIKTRYKLIGDFIQDIINNKIILSEALISVIYLYYDGWDKIINQKWNIIMSYE